YHHNRISFSGAFLFTAGRVFEIDRAEKIYPRRGVVADFCLNTIEFHSFGGDSYLKNINLNSCDGQILTREIIERPPYWFAVCPDEIPEIDVVIRGRSSEVKLARNPFRDLANHCDQN